MKRLFSPLVCICILVMTTSLHAADDNYTLPESYYNSLKNLEQPVNPSPEPSTDNNANTEPAQEPVVLAQNEDVAAQNKSLPSELNNSYILTEIGNLRAEIEGMKKGVDADKTAGYDGGFFLRSSDKKFSLNIGARMQFGYSVNFAEDVQDGHSLALRVAFLILTGNVFSEKLTYAILWLPQFAPSLGYIELAYTFSDVFALHVAYDTIAASPFTTMSGGKLMFISRSLPAKRFDVGDSLQVFVTGSIKWFSYNLSVANGPGTDYNINANTELSYNGRFDFSILGKMSAGEGDQANSEKPALAMGMGATFGHYDDGSQDRLMSGTADLQFKYHGFAFEAGGFFRQIDPNQFTRAQTDLGAVAQASYFIIPGKLEFALRTSALFDDITEAGVNKNMGAGNETKLGGALSGGDVGGDSDNEWEYSTCFGYYFNGFNAKVQAQYSMIIDGIVGPDDLVNHIGMLMVQVGF